jgi:hypothetical protein
MLKEKEGNKKNERLTLKFQFNSDH